MKKLFVCALAVAMVFAFTATSMAADWAFYGNARMATFSADRSKEVTGWTNGDTDTQWAVQANSRIGADVTAGDVGGKFEYGNFSLRRLYGTWNFGAGTLLVGHEWTPISNTYSNMVYDTDTDQIDTGMADDARKGQIRLTFGGFAVAFLTPKTDAYWYSGATPAALTKATALPGTANIDTSLPAIDMSYKFATDMFEVVPFLGWQSYDVTTIATDKSESIDSLVYGVGGKVNFGPAFVAARLWGGTNAANLGMSGGVYMAPYLNAAGKFKDNTVLAYSGVVGFKMSDMVSFEGGYGATSSEIDSDVTGLGKLKDTYNSYYINATITLAPGVFVVPEFGKLDYDEVEVNNVKTKEGDTTYFGAKWQINF